MQRSLRSLLSVDVADFTGLMSGKVKYYVGKLLVTLILLSMKLSGNLAMFYWKTGLRMLSNNIESRWLISYRRIISYSCAISNTAAQLFGLLYRTLT